MDFLSLSGKQILITGASSGIGRAIAIEASRAGAKVLITARRKEELQKTLSCMNGNEHAVISADLTLDEDLKSLVENCPALDGIVHCAGLISPFPVKYIGKKQIEEIYNINYFSPVLLTSSLLQKKKINKEASIIFISSISSIYAHKGGALYSGSKAGLNAYSKTLAVELCSKKIRSNTILAAMVKTEIFEETVKVIGKEAMESHGKDYLLGFGEPEDIANTCLFLLSRRSKWITGTEIVMDGGLTAGR